MCSKCRSAGKPLWHSTTYAKSRQLCAPPALLIKVFVCNWSVHCRATSSCQSYSHSHLPKSPRAKYDLKQGIAELMVFYVERANQFTLDYGDIWEPVLSLRRKHVWESTQRAGSPGNRDQPAARTAWLKLLFLQVVSAGVITTHSVISITKVSASGLNANGVEYFLKQSPQSQIATLQPCFFNDIF